MGSSTFHQQAGEGGASDFRTTHWTMVLNAARQDSPGSAEALQQLCCAYWYPLYAYIRRRGYTAEAAEDLTQEFFTRLIDTQGLVGLSREGGKFRSYLLTALKNLLANEWNREHAQKRSGGKKFIRIDDTAELRYQREMIEASSPEILFERQWALTLLERVLDRLRADYSADGKEELFRHLEGCLPRGTTELSYAASAKALNMTEEAVRMAARRLRQNYGKLLRAEIAATVSSRDEIDSELRHLIAVIGGE